MDIMDTYTTNRIIYLELKNQYGGGNMIKYNNRLYRVRTIDENTRPNFSHPLWFVDNPYDIFWIWLYRENEKKELRQNHDTKQLMVDIYDVKSPLDLFSFNHLDYNDVLQYIKIKKPECDIKHIQSDEQVDNHIYAQYLADNIKLFDIDGWYEKGIPSNDDNKRMDNMNEIMLLPIAHQKLIFVCSNTIDQILSKII